MRRIALVLACLGIATAAGLAAAPAQAHERWSGDHPRYEETWHGHAERYGHEWRERRVVRHRHRWGWHRAERRAAAFERRGWMPEYLFGFFHR